MSPTDFGEIQIFHKHDHKVDIFHSLYWPKSRIHSSFIFRQLVQCSPKPPCWKWAVCLACVVAVCSFGFWTCKSDLQYPEASPPLLHRELFTYSFKVGWSSTQSQNPELEIAVVVNALLAIQIVLKLNIMCVQIAPNTTLQFLGPLTTHAKGEANNMNGSMK